MIDTLVNEIRAHRYRYANEDELQQALLRVLLSAGFFVRAEVRLSSRDRIDFVVAETADKRGYGPCTTGIEVKVDGGTAGVRRQLARYASHDELDRLILVTNRARHLSLGGEITGKRVDVVRVIGAIA